MTTKSRHETRTGREAKKFLADVPEKYVFQCQDGRALRNLKELGEALVTMTDETFSYHSNTVKKDFSNWVRDIVRDEKLSRDLERATSRTLAAWYVTTRVASLTKRLS